MGAERNLYFASLSRKRLRICFRLTNALWHASRSYSQYGRPVFDRSLSRESRKCTGRQPLNWLPAKNISTSRPSSGLPRPGGTSPDRLFFDRFSQPMLARSPSSGGIPPVNAFDERSSVLRFSIRPNSGGIPFAKAFSDRSNLSRPLKLPNSGGIPPVKSFPERFKTSRSTKLPSSGGIGPVSRLLERLMYCSF